METLKAERYVQNLLTSAGDDNRLRRLTMRAISLRPWFKKWMDAFPSHPVT